MSIAKHFVVPLENKPGELAHLASILSGVSVNIQAISIPETPHGKAGKIRLLVDDEARAKKALVSANIPFEEEEVIVLYLENKPGALAGLADKLSREKIELEYAYAVSHKGSATTPVIVKAIPRSENTTSTPAKTDS